MKKYITLVAILLLVIPINIFAKEKAVTIECDKYEVQNKDEVECRGIITTQYNVTGIQGKIIASRSLTITNLEIDKEFKGDCNKNYCLLYRDNTENKAGTFITFNVKIDKLNSPTIELTDFILSDKKYKSHEVDKTIIEFEREKTVDTTDEYEQPIEENDNTKTILIIIISIALVILVTALIYLIATNKKEK